MHELQEKELHKEVERLETECKETYKTLVEVESEERETDEQVVTQLNTIAHLQVQIRRSTNIH